MSSTVDIQERIAKLESYKSAIKAWRYERLDSDTRTELRTIINRNKSSVRREIIEAGCYKTFTISPPPALGGLIMRDIDLLDAMFDPPYSMDVVPSVVDMIDETIGVMSTPDFQRVQEEVKMVEVTSEIEVGYAFIAMPMSPDDSQLEDVLDAIKEACKRCGVTAERVDEPAVNERITDRILESIRRAEYVIVDLTHSRPNVFYEAGYAHGLGKIPIYIARESTKLEFDLKDYPVIFFRNIKQLKDSLEKRIRGLSEARR